MTATAFAFDPDLDLLDPALDIFDDGVAPARPQLRLIQGNGFGHVLAPSPSDLATIELHRRRRFLALLAVTTLVLAIAWAAGISVTGFVGEAAPATGEAVPAVHVVMPGDSYGAIASELGAANPNAAGEVLRAANGGGELVIGQRLVVDASLSAAVVQAGA